MNRQEKILLWSSNIWYFGSGLFGPLFAVFTQRVGGDILSITWIWGAYLISMGVFVILVGLISDRMSTKQNLALLGYALNALFTFCYLTVDTPEKLLLVELGLGFATALSAPTWSALYDQYSGDGATDGTVWGYSSGFEKIATGLGVILGGYIVAQMSFQVLFVAMGIIQTLALFVQMRLNVKKSRRRKIGRFIFSRWRVRL